MNGRNHRRRDQLYSRQRRRYIPIFSRKCNILSLQSLRHPSSLNLFQSNKYIPLNKLLGQELLKVALPNHLRCQWLCQSQAKDIKGDSWWLLLNSQSQAAMSTCSTKQCIINNLTQWEEAPHSYILHRESLMSQCLRLCRRKMEVQLWKWLQSIMKMQWHFLLRRARLRNKSKQRKEGWLQVQQAPRSRHNRKQKVGSIKLIKNMAMNMVTRCTMMRKTPMVWKQVMPWDSYRILCNFSKCSVEWLKILCFKLN